MADIRNTARCGRCGKDFPFSQVRYLPDGKRLACRPCLGTAQKESEDEIKRQEQLFDYQCVACRYRFQRTPGKEVRLCPSCGETTLLKFDSERLDGKKILKLADDPRLDDIGRRQLS